MSALSITNKMHEMNETIDAQEKQIAALAAQVEALRERHARICRDLKIWQPLADSPCLIANDKLEQAALAILNDTPEIARERERKRDAVEGK